MKFWWLIVEESVIEWIPLVVSLVGAIWLGWWMRGLYDRRVK